ncbi:MAG: hypothetical protein H0U44_06845 [Flavisolibacter sp.]|jgi:uncharacterized protein (DUF2141 family)|nr:hypothetical protein [Flavisolibacter sp.]
MKTLFTLITATFISVAAFAANEGILTITLANAGNASISVNGRTYQFKSKTLVLHDLRPGNYAIRIFLTAMPAETTREETTTGTRM